MVAATSAWSAALGKSFRFTEEFQAAWSRFFGAITWGLVYAAALSASVAEWTGAIRRTIPLGEFAARMRDWILHRLFQRKVHPLPPFIYCTSGLSGVPFSESCLVVAAVSQSGLTGIPTSQSILRDSPVSESGLKDVPTSMSTIE
jgi:hypothetical protein